MPDFARVKEHLRTPLFRNAYALLANQGVNSVLGVAFWVAAARMFPADVVGQNAALLSTMAFVGLLSQLGMRHAMAWILPMAGRDAGRWVRVAYGVSAALTLVLGPAALLVLGGSDATSELIANGAAFVAWFTAAAILSSLFALQDGVLVGLRSAMWVPIENAVFGVAKIAILPLLTASALGIFAAWTVSLVPMVILVNGLIVLRLLPAVSEVRPHHARIGRPLDVVRFVSGDFVGNLMIQGTIRLIPIMVIAAISTAANAYSFQAWTISLPVFLVAGSMMSSLTVESLTTPDQAIAYARRMLVNITRLLVPASLLLVLAAPLVLQLFGDEYATQATPLLRLLALSTLPITLNVWYYAMCRIRGTVFPIVTIQAMVAGMTIVIGLLLLPVIGIVATGIGWLVGQSMAAIIVVLREFNWVRGVGLVWPAGGLQPRKDG